MNKNDNKYNYLSLHGKTILVTGVSRSGGIGAEIARVLAENGAHVVIHGFYEYDQEVLLLFFTSGQQLGPMIDEIAYAVSKEAIAGLIRQAAFALADLNIQVNCINPGPVDTGYLEGEMYAKVAQCFPGNKWGTPADTARLVHFLQSDYSSWITGQAINSEGGFDRQKLANSI